jgi:hypothetical protein
MSSVARLALIALLPTLTGCAVFKPIQNVSKATWSAFKPSSWDYAPGDDATGEWDFVGIEGRGDKPLEREYDKLDYWMKSPKHREIERNLGIQ